MLIPIGEKTNKTGASEFGEIEKGSNNNNKRTQKKNICGYE